MPVIEIRVGSILLAAVEVILALICKSPTHHWLHAMSDIAIHDNIVFLDNSDATGCVIAVFLVLHVAPLIVLLGLHYVTSQHLRVLYFYLRVVEYIVIVVDVLDNLYWLLTVALLLRL